MGMTVPVEVPGQLTKSGSVTLDSNGQGVVVFDPENMRQRWEVTSVLVSTNQPFNATVVPVASLMLNSIIPSAASQGNMRGATWSGNQDTFRGKTDVGPCDFLAVAFTPPPGQSGASMAGVIASVVIAGTKFTRRS